MRNDVQELIRPNVIPGAAAAPLEHKLWSGMSKQHAAALASLRRMIWIRWLTLAGASLAQGACRNDGPAVVQRGAGDSLAIDPAERERELRALITATRPFTQTALPASYDLGMTMRDPVYVDRKHVGSFAWTDEQWRLRCAGVRTSYNPDHDLDHDTLTLRPNDPRWLDFVFWSLSNKVNEHQLEAFGGTGWRGPTSGVLFHWAPGSHWERDILHSFGFVIGHVVGEHRWTDTMFPDFFERYGGVYGVNVKDRLAEIGPRSNAAWVAFIDYIGGSESPYFRYLLHIDTSVDIPFQRIALTAGQGVAFNYSFNRYQAELAMILTDCSAFQFFQMYDRFGPGFAAQGNWANQAMPATALSQVGYASHLRYAPGIGAGGAAPGALSRPDHGQVEIPPDLPEVDRMHRGEKIYLRECAVCHGELGNGAGYLAEGLDVKPRDFRQATYKFRSTPSGALPTMSDIERTVRDGVPGTSMPAWGQFLKDGEIGDVARYLVVFSPDFARAWRKRVAPHRLEISPVPPEVALLAAHPGGNPRPCSDAPVAHSYACDGEKLWHVMLCRWCHGDQGRGDGQTGNDLTDAWGNRIPPADLTYKWLFKNGHQPRDVYRSVFGGLNGTPMQPQTANFQKAPLTEQERWSIVGYVLSLSPPVRPVLHLSAFPAERGKRIGPNGRIVAARRGD
jgi:mono/diheme cytochrome c family protein